MSVVRGVKEQLATPKVIVVVSHSEVPEPFLNVTVPVRVAREFTDVTVEVNVRGCPRIGELGEIVGVLIDESPLRIVNVNVAVPVVKVLKVAVSVKVVSVLVSVGVPLITPAALSDNPAGRVGETE